METFICNCVTYILLGLSLWFFPMIVEKFITLTLGIIALVNGADTDKMPKKDVNKH